MWLRAAKGKGWRFASTTPEAGWLIRSGYSILSRRLPIRRAWGSTFRGLSCAVSRVTCFMNQRPGARRSWYSCQPPCERARMITMSSKIQVLLIDDHSLFRESLSRLLQTESDFDIVGTCASASQALALPELKDVDVVLLDYDLGHEQGT